VDAIIAIEEKLNKEYDSVDGASLKDSPIFAKMKEIVDKGNVTKIIVTKGEKTIVNFPVTAGVIGAVLIPWGAILGIIAALGTQCNIGFIDENGDVLDLNGKVVGVYDKAKDAVLKGVDKAQQIGKSGLDSETLDKAGDKIEDFAYKTSDKLQELGDKGSAKVEAAWDKFEESGKVEEIKEAFVSGTAKIMELWDRLEKSGKIDEVKEAVDKVARKAAGTAKSIAKEASDRVAKAEEADFEEEPETEAVETEALEAEAAEADVPEAAEEVKE
jgi:hypothetical protein